MTSMMEEDHRLNSRIIVAVAATLSLTATSLLFVYVIILFLISSARIRFLLPDPLVQPLKYDRRAHWLSEIQTWAQIKLAFIHTPFGIMFMNLVFADFIQALGFSMNYVWVKQPDVSCVTRECAATCTFQGVLIQFGDLASAYSNLMIAIQTYIILIFSWHLPLWSAWATIPLIWIIVVALGVVAPTINQTWTGSNPFYTWTGAWCWINQAYGPLRLYLHYFWIFVAAFASIALYGHLFWRLRVHFRSSRSTRTHGALSVTDPLRKKLERKAQGMLIYPIGFIIMILPLSTYRLAALAGHDWGITAAGVAGSMYCLSGFVDVLLFGITRSIISLPSLGSGKSSTMAMIGAGGMSSSGVGHHPTTRSAFRVQVVQETVIDLDEPSFKESQDPTPPSHLSLSRKTKILRSNDHLWPVFERQVPALAWYHPGGASVVQSPTP